MIDEQIGVIFDWDGVIIDSHDQHELSWQKLAEENNKTLQPPGKRRDRQDSVIQCGDESDW